MTFSFACVPPTDSGSSPPDQPFRPALCQLLDVRCGSGQFVPMSGFRRHAETYVSPWGVSMGSTPHDLPTLWRTDGVCRVHPRTALCRNAVGALSYLTAGPPGAARTCPSR